MTRGTKGPGKLGPPVSAVPGTAQWHRDKKHLPAAGGQLLRRRGGGGGAKDPGTARGMGMKTRSTVMEAFEDAKKFVGENPNVLVLPMTFKRPSVHLCMEDEK